MVLPEVLRVVRFGVSGCTGAATGIGIVGAGAGGGGAVGAIPPSKSGSAGMGGGSWTCASPTSGSEESTGAVTLALGGVSSPVASTPEVCSGFVG